MQPHRHVDRHQSGKQGEGEEERGSQVNHSLIPYLSTAAQRSDRNFDPSRFHTALKRHYVHGVFDCQASRTKAHCHAEPSREPISDREDGFPASDVMTPKKKPQPLRAGALRCRRGGGRVPITAGGYRQNVLPAFGFRKNLDLEKSGQKNEAPRMRTGALRRQLPSKATISRPRLSHNPSERFGKALARGFAADRRRAGDEFD